VVGDDDGLMEGEGEERKKRKKKAHSKSRKAAPVDEGKLAVSPLHQEGVVWPVHTLSNPPPPPPPNPKAQPSNPLCMYLL
jgi:hypothetical protein